MASSNGIVLIYCINFRIILIAIDDIYVSRVNFRIMLCLFIFVSYVNSQITCLLYVCLYLLVFRACVNFLDCVMFVDI